MTEDKVSEGPARKGNSLTIVGTGINAAHLTREAANWIEHCDALLYCVADCATELLLKQLNPNNEDLYRFYSTGKPRRQTYSEMAERILQVLREGKNVCAAYYGHPGMFVRPAHVAIEKAREEGYDAWMYPAVSSIDCMVADLGVDFSWDGCQIFEATQFLLRDKQPDLESGLILLQVGCVGDSSFNVKGFDSRHFPILMDRLTTYYGSNYQLVIYEAATFSVCNPRIDIVQIKNLRASMVTGITTLYIPPMKRASQDRELGKFFRENQAQYSTI